MGLTTTSMPKRGGAAPSRPKRKATKGARADAKATGRCSKAVLVDIQRETLHILSLGKKVSTKSLQRSATACAIESGVGGLPECKTGAFELKVDVVRGDTLEVAMSLQDESAVGASRKGRDRVCVLVFGSGENAGGGYKRGAGGQEESICRRTNLVQCVESAKYPLPEHGCLYVPNLVVVRRDRTRGFSWLQRPCELSAVVAHAYMSPQLSRDGTLATAAAAGTARKITSALAAMSRHGHTRLVLGAFGCGAYANPPASVARLFRKALESDALSGRFKSVTFAILNNKAAMAAFSMEFLNR